MKLKDIIALALFFGILGCGQSHRTGSNLGNSSASGQAVPNPEQGAETSDSDDPDDTNEDVSPESDPTEAEFPDASDSSDAADPNESDDSEPTETIDASDPSEITESSAPDSEQDESEPQTQDPLETPSPGTYSYERIPVGGFGAATRAAFHPSGEYALILSEYDTVHVYDWESQTTTPINIGTNRNMQLSDVAFSSDGSSAWITATHTQNGQSGMVLRFDDAVYRAQTEGSDPAQTISTWTSAMTGKSAKAIALPWDGSFPIVAFQSGQSGNYIWTLRNFHPDTGEFEELYTSINAESPAEDIAIVNNEFGTWGALVVGGSFDADTRYYTELSGQGEWRSNLGNIGNANRVEAYPGGEYALVVSWSGRSIYRFKEGAFASYTQAPRFPSMGIWDVSFQGDGRRALLSGRASANGAAGTLLEYRHDLYSCEETSTVCGENAITDVSIWGFDNAPWQAGTNAYIFDTAFRPGCDGGILIGSYGTSSGQGFLGEFQIENREDCRID